MAFQILHVPTKRPLPALPLPKSEEEENESDSQKFVSVDVLNTDEDEDDGVTSIVRLVTSDGAVVTVKGVDFAGLDTALSKGDLAKLKGLQSAMAVEKTFTASDAFNCAATSQAYGEVRSTLTGSIKTFQ